MGELKLNDYKDGDIESMLEYFVKVKREAKKLAEEEDKLKIKIKIYLKERNWMSYKDQKSDVSVSISTYQQESIDKDQLKLMLNQSQLAQVTKIKTIEKTLIMTPDARNRMKQFMKK